MGSNQRQMYTGAPDVQFYWQRWRFPYERSTWCHSVEQCRRWYRVCESQGVEQVREQLKAVLARGAGPRGSIAIWTEPSVTIGFCQEWLSWHDRRKANREDVHRRRQIFWPLIVAVLLAAIGWLVMSK
jgi:hypothetical protein